MPSRHEVASLYTLSEDAYAEHFARSWEEYWIDGRGNGNFLEFLRYIPHSVANTIIVKILRFYIEKRRRGYYRICDLLSVFYNVDLTCLDLTELVAIGPRGDHHLKKFESTFMSWLPKLTKLTKLYLRTHTLQTTLPICSDDLLHGIGQNMQNLRLLDVSKNNLVTDYGLEYLLPTSGFGCPLLEELFVFECSVTIEGIARVVENLSNLRIVGYKETGEVIKFLYDKFNRENNEKLEKGLKLTHVNNLGASGLVRHLGCNNKLVDAITTLCPELMNFKVRIADENTYLLQRFDKLKVLEIFYYEPEPHMDIGSADYFKVCGYQLYSLTLLSATFCSRYFLIIGECCPNLHKFWFTCYTMHWDMVFDNNKNHDVFKSLDTLYFRIGFSETDISELSLSLFKYILQNTCTLSDFRLICRSATLTDSWLKSLWKSIKTDKLVKVLIALPFLNVRKRSLPLTMLSVNLILEQSSCLQYLGNLLVWDVTYQEMKSLKTYLNLCNFNVNLVYHPMKIK